MRVLIIEDEQLSADDLADTIGRIDPSITVTHILNSVREAVRYFRQAPADIDLIFSDIQLGDGLSFEIFREVRPTQPVIFCTAFDAYAVEAFKNNGLDYVLKPFDDAAVAVALQKYRDLKAYFSPGAPDFCTLIELLGRQPSPAASILVYHKERILPIALSDIALFYIDLEVTRLITFDKKNYIVSQTLDQLEKVCGRRFFRTNRQYLLNRGVVTGASQYLPRKYTVDLSIEFPEAIVVGKTRTASFLAWLTQQ